MKLIGLLRNFANTPKNARPTYNCNYFQKKELQKDKRKSFGPSSSVTGETKITNYGTKGEREGGQGREAEREQITNAKFH